MNVDAALIQSGGAALTRLEDKVVALSNGCVCCTLREDLLAEMIGLAKTRAFDYIVIESSGISEPMPVAEVFTFADEKTGERLDDHAYLDTCVTVVDAAAFPADFRSADSLADRDTAAYQGVWACGCWCGVREDGNFVQSSAARAKARCNAQHDTSVRRRQAQRRRLARGPSRVRRRHHRQQDRPPADARGCVAHV